MFDYALCGWRLACGFELPELQPWRGGDRAPDVVVRLNETSPPGDYPIEISCLLKGSAGGRLCLTVPGVAQYHLFRGSEISIIAPPGAELTDVRAFLFNAVLALIAHQRGLLPLRATTIRGRGRTVAFVGRAASGLSTLAAALAQRGYRLLCDDITILDAAHPEPVVLPTLPRVKLWRDALAALCIPVAGLAKNRSTQEKYIYRPATVDVDVEVPMRLQRLYMLHNNGLVPARAEARVREEITLQALTGFIASPAVATALGRVPAMLRLATNMLRELPVYELSYHIDYKNISASIDAVEEALGK